MHALAGGRAFDRGERARDVLRHRFLVHQRLLAFLALLPLVAPALFERPGTGRGGRHRPRPARPPYGGAAWAAPPAPPRPARRRPSPPGAAWAVRALPSACASRAPSAPASVPPAPA